MFGINRKQKVTTTQTILLKIVPWIVPVTLLLLWQWGAETGRVIVSLFPPPTKLAQTFYSMLVSGKLWKNLSISFIRVGKGFLLGTALGIALGFLMGLCRPANRILSALVGIIRPIPFLALIPVFILILGIGEVEKMAVIAYGTFWSVFLNTISGIQNVDIKLLEVAYLFRTSNFKTITKIVLPAAVPTILTGLRLGVSSAWMSVVGAEMIAATSGIGYLITYARTLARADEMYVCVLVIGFIGLAIDKVLVIIQNAYIKKTRGIAF